MTEQQLEQIMRDNGYKLVDVETTRDKTVIMWTARTVRTPGPQDRRLF